MTFVRGPPGSTWRNIQVGEYLSTIQENELLRALSESRMSGYFRVTNGDLDVALTKRYKDTLWRNALRFSFPHAPTGQPEYIFTRVRHLNILRNRIAHHEPIHRRDIARDFEICIEVLQAISPTIAQWSAENSRVLQVLAERP